MKGVLSMKKEDFVVGSLFGIGVLILLFIVGIFSLRFFATVFGEGQIAYLLMYASLIITVLVTHFGAYLYYKKKGREKDAKAVILGGGVISWLLLSVVLTELVWGTVFAEYHIIFLSIVFLVIYFAGLLSYRVVKKLLRR